MTGPRPPLPPHDPAPETLVPASIRATWPVGTFLENLVVAADGTIFCTVHPTGAVYRLDPQADVAQPFGVIGGTAAGLVLGSGGRLFVMSGYPGQGAAAVWVLSADGRATLWCEIPGGIFLNGASAFGADSLLVVDSVNGSIFEVGMDQPQVSLWFKDARLTQRPDTPLFPGANGVKLRGTDVIVSNTDRAQLYQIAVQPDGRAGPFSLLADRLLFDDFAVGADGALYGCAHAYNQVVRLAPDGTRTVLAGVAAGIVNPTAAAFGATAADQSALYVTTTGGVAAPLESGLEPARLVRLDLGGLATTGMV